MLTKSFLESPEEGVMKLNTLQIIKAKWEHLRATRWYGIAKIIIILSLYLIVGCLAYNHFEGWSVGKTLGFTIITITTVGTMSSPSVPFA
jgi:hypothetical protein